MLLSFYHDHMFDSQENLSYQGEATNFFSDEENLGIIDKLQKQLEVYQKQNKSLKRKFSKSIQESTKCITELQRLVDASEREKKNVQNNENQELNAQISKMDKDLKIALSEKKATTIE